MKTTLNEALIALHEYIEAREDKGDMEELKTIYNAFKDADGWLPYPKNIPSDYIFQIIQSKDNEVSVGYHANGRWYSVVKELVRFVVIYFRPLPAPYQPKQDKP